MKAECSRIVVSMLTFAALGAAAAQAADPADKCEATKLREAGKAASCMLSAASRGVLAGAEAPGAADACASKFEAKVASAEAKADGDCPTTGDAAALLEDIEDLVSSAKQSVTGGRFVDNGDGTVTDVEQDIIWQQQTAGTGSVSSTDEVRDAAGILSQLGALNGGGAVAGLGGSSAWGLPSVAQLLSILDCSESPCVLVDSTLGPNPTPAGAGWTYLVSGETDSLPVSSLPCIRLVRLEDGSVICEDLTTAALGRSRARVMRNAR